MTGEKTGEMTEEGGYETDRHRWIVLDIFGWFQIPYESTALCLWNPTWNGYKTTRISEGYVNGVHFDNETDLIWMDYN